MSNKPKASQNDQLRTQAQRRLPKSIRDTPSLSSEEATRLVYELEIYQEELEVQNEELRRAQLEIKNARDRYLSLYDFAPVGYLTLNARSEIAEANLTACDLLGRERRELIGVRLDLLFDAASRTQLRSHLDQVMATGNRSGIELQIATAGEMHVRLETCRSQHEENDDFQCRTVITDITARKQAENATREKDRLLREEIVDRQRVEDRLREQEKQLAHFARINTMGAMVAGIAHEINQPLQAISTYATACEIKLLQSDVDQHADMIKMVRQIAGQAVRSGKIVKSLREFVRQTNTSRSYLRIADVINESVQLTASEARRHKVAVCLAIDDQLPDVFADRVQLQQVLVNLIMNACQAMGTVKGQRVVTIRAGALADRLDIAVEDLGEGLVPEMATSVFDAFHSTKEDGMGLGLAISRSIIEAHGGQIWTTPNSQRGTVFHFTIPAGTQALQNVE